MARCRDAGRGAQPCRAPEEPAAGPMKLLLLHTPVPAQLFFPFPSFYREINLFGNVPGRQRAMAGVQPGLWEPNPTKKAPAEPPRVIPTSKQGRSMNASTSAAARDGRLAQHHPTGPYWCDWDRSHLQQRSSKHSVLGGRQEPGMGGRKVPHR